ncbi:hypothetical protein QUF84_18015 [Fictibacillus enclensis]|nr:MULTISPECIES: hypothetical protein [Fictibacillus]SFD64818.1 hypothetical protein SAMN05428981_1011266 [Bacillus sp. OV194]MCQ6268863.1 hypothetical protein [Fictibacillus sp. WQ 8-8]MDM5199818.1 hypothetical protein [Fictibacillus enclensis]MDM5339102.1 hypothetical protein [Fictibacillus enclensis]MED2972449.1 hypothetical protein [Fictibacillus sp. B-59209]
MKSIKINMFFSVGEGYLRRAIEAMKRSSDLDEKTFKEYDEACFVAGYLAGDGNKVTVEKNRDDWTVKILERRT